MLKLNEKQQRTKETIEKFATLFNIDSNWASSVAMVESSLGLNQLSPTGCKGVFNMSTIAMRDLLVEMVKRDDELIDIACGVAFLYLLLRRHGDIKSATAHFCAPEDRAFYLPRMEKYLTELKEIS